MLPTLDEEAHATTPNDPKGERTPSDGVVVLDRFRLDDAQAHLAGEDEEHARRFGWYPARSTLETVQTAILGWLEQWRTGGPTRAFAVRDARTGELVGGCEVRLKGGGLASMSYWTFPAHRRRGLASRAVCLACSYAYRELGVQRMDLHIAADNVASRGVARCAGFTQASLVPPEGKEVGEAKPQLMVRYSRVGPQPCAMQSKEFDAGPMGRLGARRRPAPPGPEGGGAKGELPSCRALAAPEQRG